MLCIFYDCRRTNSRWLYHALPQSYEPFVQKMIFRLSQTVLQSFLQDLDWLRADRQACVIRPKLVVNSPQPRRVPARSSSQEVDSTP